MKQVLTVDEIIGHFTLLEEEQEFIKSNAPHNKLGKALLLKFFQYEFCFPEDQSEIPRQAIDYIAQQLDLSPDIFESYNWYGRSIKTHRKDIREVLGFRPASLSDQDSLHNWLLNEIIPDEHRPTYLEELTYSRLRELYIEPPSRKQINRLITSAIYNHEQRLFTQTSESLPAETKAQLRNLIQNTGELDEDLLVDADELLDYPIHELKVGAGEAKVNNIKRVCARLKRLQDIDLPTDLFEGIPLRFLRQYRQQVAVESPSHLQAHNKGVV